MKLKLLLVLLFSALVVAIHPPQARAQDEVSFDYFYDTLAPYGEWIEVDGYGYCWHPTNVDADWAPYTDGYWAYTDAGWTWVSYEEYGAIVYHYGRWTEVDGEGWCWTPDYEWAPAWVSWRSNNDYVGWAPLPPEARWQADIGFNDSVDDAYDIGPDYYHFCRIGDFGAPVLRGVIVRRSQNWSLMGRTRNITNMSYASFGGSRVVFNGGPNYAALRDVTHKPIPALKLVQNSHIDMAAIHGGRGGKLIATQKVGNQLIVFAPRVSALADPGFLKAKIKRVIQADKVTKGWASAKDPGARQELKQQLQAQSKGGKPEAIHTRPVTAAETPGGTGRPNGNGPAGFEEKQHGKIGKPTPSAGVVVQPNQPAVTTPHEKNFDPQHQAQVERDAKGRAMQKERENGVAAQAQKEAVINQEKNAAAQHQAQVEAQGKAVQKDKERGSGQSEKDARMAEFKRQQQQQEQEAHSKQRPPEPSKPQPSHEDNRQNHPPQPAPAQANDKKGGNPPSDKEKNKGKDKDKDKDKNGN